MNRILSERQFQQPHRSFSDRIYTDVVGAIDRFLARLLTNHGLSLLGFIVAGALTVMALVVAARFARRARMDPGDEPGARRLTHRPAVEWDAEASRHEAAGEWTDALRCRYRALVAELGRRGVVDEVPGRTAGEYSRQVADRLPTSSGPFRLASDIFEEAWYGFGETGQPDLARFQALAGEVLERR